jgi:cytochrome c oxidase subunit 2
MLAEFDSSFWMPTDASTYAGRVDWVFHFILAIAAFFFVLIAAVMLVFVIRYHRRPGREPQPSAHHSTPLELTWTIIPTILVVIIFVVGFRGYMDIATPPANAYDITVIAQRWSWAFQYPNGYVDANLHVPVDRPIRLKLVSRDVIHSFYVPAFRLKKDAVPGRYNQAWFAATKINDTQGYDLFCAEYCGTSHSNMLAKVYVHDATAFARWLEDASKWEGRITPKQRGMDLYTQRGCTQCHSIDGTTGIGPTLKGAWDHIAEGTVAFRDGTQLKAFLRPDYTPTDYVRESLEEPDAHYVAGFTPAMPSYKGQIKENDIPAIVAFLKSVSDKYKAEAQTQPTATTQPTSREAASGTGGQAASGTRAEVR